MNSQSMPATLPRRRTAGLTRCWRPQRVRVHTCGRRFAEIWWIVCVFQGNPPADALHRAQRKQHLLMSHKRVDVIKVCWFENANYLCIGCMIGNIHINSSDVMMKNRKEKYAEKSQYLSSLSGLYVCFLQAFSFDMTYQTVTHFT